MAFLLGARSGATQSSAPLLDTTVMSSANGAGIPFGYGTFAVAANIIWSPGLVETSTTVTQSGGKGGPTTTSVQYEYTCSFAAAFCEGPGSIIKIWGDVQVLYDGTSSSVAYEGIFNSANLYQVGQIVEYDNGSTTLFYICIRTINALPFPNPSNGIYWSVYTQNPVALSGGQQYPSPTMYPGNDTQMPDPTIQAALGVNSTSAFRGLIYAVWENLQLNNFGNRIPSIRGIVQTGTPTGSPPGSSSSTSGVDYIVTDLCSRSGVPSDVVNATDLAPIITTLADVYQEDGSGIPALALLTGGVVTYYQGSGCGAPWEFTYPGDGANQPLPSPLFSYPMQPNQTIMFNPYPATQDSTTGSYKSFCPGWTTLTSYDLIPMAIVGVTSGGSGPATWDGTAVVPWVPGNVGDWSQANWNMAVCCQISIAVAGQYTFYCSSNDAVIIGFGNGATRVSGPMVNNSSHRQTKTCIKGYPIVMMENIDMGEHDDVPQPHSDSTLSTFVVNFPKTGTYGIEVNYACHVDARCLCLNWDMNGQQSPLLPISGATGANPIAESFGYVITEQKDGRSLINDLKNAYFFDCAESDFMMNWIRRGVHPSVMTIPEADLGLIADNAKLKETITQEQDAPRIVTVTYTDPSIDYQQGSQYKLRSSRVVTSLNQTTVDLPLVLTETMALQVAELTLYSTWMERTPYELNLWKSFYALLDPTDTVDFVFESVPYQQRLTELSIGQDYSLKLEGVSQFTGGYTSQAVGSTPQGTVAVVLPAGGPSFAMIYDLPYLQDSDASSDRSQTGFYWFLNGASVTWPGGVLLQSPNGSIYSTLGNQAATASYGYANAALADAPRFWTWDNSSTLSITMTRGSLAGASDSDVLNGANALLIGNELVQFANCTQTGDNTYMISRLLRGRRNTEPFGTGHAAPSGSPPMGELVVVLTTAVQRNDFGLSFIGMTEEYKAVTSGGDPTAVTAENFTSAGNDLKPASPVFIKGIRDGSNNLTIGWIRRTRYGGDWLESTPYVPLNEDSEAYSIDIVSGSTVLRTITWTSGTYDGNGNPTASYSATEQTADGITPGNPVTLNIYQISAQVGRGFPGKATI
jgi:hypothetical protein